MNPDEGALHRMVPFEEDEEMLALEDAAQRFGVDVRTVVDCCHKGKDSASDEGSFTELPVYHILGNSVGLSTARQGRE